MRIARNRFLELLVLSLSTGRVHPVSGNIGILRGSGGKFQA